MKRPGLTGFLLSYLVVTLMALCGVLTEVVKETQQRLDSGDPVEAVGRVIQAILVSLLVGLLAIPVRLLLGLFPENSTSSGVRFVRRALFGMLVGPLPLLLILALSGGEGNAEELLSIGVIIGLAVGIVDSLVWDSKAATTPGEPPLG